MIRRTFIKAIISALSVALPISMTEAGTLQALRRIVRPWGNRCGIGDHPDVIGEHDFLQDQTTGVLTCRDCDFEWDGLLPALGRPLLVTCNRFHSDDEHAEFMGFAPGFWDDSSVVISYNSFFVSPPSPHMVPTGEDFKIPDLDYSCETDLTSAKIYIEKLWK